MKAKHFKLFVGLAVFFAVGLSWFAYAKITKEIRRASVRAVADHVVDVLNLKPGDPVNKNADAIRQFVYASSVHNIDKAFYALWGHNKATLERLLAAYRGQGPRPHMECSSRSGIVEILLRALGYRTHSIVVYRLPKDSQARNFPSHTFIEVYDPAAKKWEVQDPDYDVFWVNRKTGQRAGIREIIASDLQTVVPCIRQGNCGWGVTSAEGAKIADVRSYFGMASIRDYRAGRRPLLVNTTRFPKSEVVRFCETIKKDCRQRIIYLPKPASSAASPMQALVDP